MSYMFFYVCNAQPCRFMEDPIINLMEIYQIIINNVIYMDSMFTDVIDFNHSEDQNINTKIVKYTDSDRNEQKYIAWDTSKVTHSRVFNKEHVRKNHNFNGDISKWNTSNVTDMGFMFYSANGSHDFNQDISRKLVESVRETKMVMKYHILILHGIFKKVTSMFYMFYNAKEFNQNIRNWTVNPKTDVTEMFSGADKMLDRYEDLIDTEGTPN